MKTTIINTHTLYILYKQCTVYVAEQWFNQEEIRKLFILTNS